MARLFPFLVARGLEKRRREKMRARALHDASSRGSGQREEKKGEGEDLSNGPSEVLLLLYSYSSCSIIEYR